MSDAGNPNPAPTPTPSAPTVIASDPSFSKLEPEMQGYFKNKGWDQKPWNDAALEAVKAYHELEKFRGIPGDQIARIPKDASDAEGWKALRLRLGAGAKPDDYDFKDVKFASGDDLDEDFISNMRNTFHQEGVPKDSAKNIAKAFVKFQEGLLAEQDALNTQRATEAEQTIAKEWGQNRQSFEFVAKQGALKLGVSEQEFDSLKGTPGYAAAMKMFLNAGRMMGEDKFIADPANRESGRLMDRSQAMARKQELIADSDFVRRFNNGDARAVREMDAIDMIIAQAA